MSSILNNESASIESIVSKALKDEETLSEVFKGIFSDNAKVKYRCAKVLRNLSQTNPETLYPKWSFFVEMLESENTFLKSDAIFIIANLARVDWEKKFERIFQTYYGLLDDKSMVTAANLVKISPVIAKAKPALQSEVTNRLLSIDETHHGPECKNVIKGHAILALAKYFEDSKDKKKILQFMKKELSNTRPATRKKAERFLKKWGEGGK